MARMPCLFYEDPPPRLLLLPCLFPLLQFRSNMADFKVHENTQLLVQFRDNILAIINAMEAMGGVMAQMPQLPVRWVACEIATLLRVQCAATCWAGCGRSCLGKRAAGMPSNLAADPALSSPRQQQPAAGPPLLSVGNLRCRLNVDLANNFLPSRPASLPAYNLAMPPPQPALNAPGMVPLTEDYGPGSNAVLSVAAAGQQQAGGGGPAAGGLPSGAPFIAGGFGGGSTPTLIKQEQPVIVKADG